MKPKSVSEILSLWLDFFAKKGHTVVPSSSLLPSGDPTLLFTTAGMVPFKPYFTGAVELPFTRATSAQKCLRTTDLENVGKTERHCTFFEMLGNFSFGDYFKKESIEYALEFSTEVLEIPKDRIWITIYENDDEAKKLWMDLGIPENRITRLGKKDNFWGPAGDSGACGPCSELYLDRGVEKGGSNCGANNLACHPGCDCDRFLEYWNLVFNQFNQTTTGEMLPLKQTGIDTGAGVERIALLLQGADSVYDTDELSKIRQKVEEISGKKYEGANKQAMRVITDHSRSVLFALSDRILPDKTGRGYVIRRLIRRASLFGRKLGFQTAFLYKLIPTLIDIYGGRYSNLAPQQKEIESIVKAEENLFLNTLDLGLEELDRLLKIYRSETKTRFSGKDSFRLYGTFGFPKEMTQELVEEAGLEFDTQGFLEELEKDRTLSRDSWKGKKTSFLTGLDSSSVPKTEFLGYETLQSKSKVLYLFSDETRIPTSEEGKEFVLVLDKTPFYPESGGQIGDTGFLKSQGVLVQILDTQKENDTILHRALAIKGRVTEGMELESEVEGDRRAKIRQHHSATHLLNSALRQTLGNHVSQKASLVSTDYLRFDFSHPKALSPEEISTIEDWVNTTITGGQSVQTKVLPIDEAKKTGAISAFDEKYGQIVRVVAMGDASIEFCGGTHVSNTNEIQSFAILKESSPGAGNRRIEAVSGDRVIDYYQNAFGLLEEKLQDHNLKAKDLGDLGSAFRIQESIPSPNTVEEEIRKNPKEAVARFRKLRISLEYVLETKASELYKAKKKNETADFENNESLNEELISKKVEYKGIFIISHQFQNVDPKSLKILGDALKKRIPNLVILFATDFNDSATLVFTATEPAIQKGIHCGNLLKTSCEVLGGKGGGRPDMAQGGGKDISHLPKALDLATQNITQSL